MSATPLPLLPPDHPDRASLAAEVHARPPEPLNAPSRATYVAVRIDTEQRAAPPAPRADRRARLERAHGAAGHFALTSRAARCGARVHTGMHAGAMLAPGCAVVARQ